MAYPDPIPILRSKDAKEFKRRLSHFRLNAAQMDLYRKGKELFDRREITND